MRSSLMHRPRKLWCTELKSVDVPAAEMCESSWMNVHQTRVLLRDIKHPRCQWDCWSTLLNVWVCLHQVIKNDSWLYPLNCMGWVGLWGFLWWAPSAKRKDHHGVSSGWSSVCHRSNTGLSSTQYEQIPIILGVWPFWLTPSFFRSITFWRANGWIVFPLLKLLSFFWLTYYCSIWLCFSVRV